MILKLPRLIRVVDLYKYFSVLPVSQLYYYKIACLIYKCFNYNNFVSQYFQNLFALNSDIHKYNTTEAQQLHASFCNTSLMKRSFLQGTALWNKLPVEIKSCNSINNFSKHLKS